MKKDIAFLLLFFATTQLIGIGILSLYFPTDLLPKELPLALQRPELPQATSFFPLFIFVLVGTGLALIFIHFKWKRVWKVWFFVSLTVLLTISFHAILPSTLAFLCAVGVVIGRVVYHNRWMYIVGELFLYGGFAVLFSPLFTIWSIVILLLLLCVYDMYAVWYSKHMVTLVKAQLEQQVFVGLLLPFKKGKQKMRSPALGGGDVAFSLLFTGVLYLQDGIFSSLIGVIFTTLSVWFLFKIAKKGTFYPALPAITMGCLVALLFSSIL